LLIQNVTYLLISHISKVSSLSHKPVKPVTKLSHYMKSQSSQN